MEALCIHLKRLMFDHKLFINISLAVGLPTNAIWEHFSSSNSKKMCLEIIFLRRDLVHVYLVDATAGALLVTLAEDIVLL